MTNRRQPLYIRVEPNTVSSNDDGHRPHSALTRLAMWATPEMADSIIVAIGIIGLVAAVGWTLIDWMTLRGWL